MRSQKTGYVIIPGVYGIFIVDLFTFLDEVLR